METWLNQSRYLFGPLRYPNRLAGLYRKFLSRLRPKQVPTVQRRLSRRESLYDAERADHVVSAKRQPNSAVSRSL